MSIKNRIDWVLVLIVMIIVVIFSTSSCTNVGMGLKESQLVLDALEENCVVPLIVTVNYDGEDGNLEFYCGQYRINRDKKDMQERNEKNREKYEGVSYKF